MGDQQAIVKARKYTTDVEMDDIRTVTIGYTERRHRHDCCRCRYLRYMDPLSNRMDTTDLIHVGCICVSACVCVWYA